MEIKTVSLRLLSQGCHLVVVNAPIRKADADQIVMKIPLAHPALMMMIAILACITMAVHALMMTTTLPAPKTNVDVEHKSVLKQMDVAVESKERISFVKRRQLNRQLVRFAL